MPLVSIVTLEIKINYGFNFMKKLTLLILLFTTSFCFSQNTWTVNVQGSSYGDETTWTLRDVSNNIILNGGPYGIPFNQTQTVSTSNEIVGSLVDAVRQIPNINPYVGVISLTGLLLLIFQSRLSYKLFHLIPAPIWLLLLSIPFVFLFDFFEPQTRTLFGRNYLIGPDLLINLPNSLSKVF